jgi:hypothetical protein
VVKVCQVATPVDRIQEVACLAFGSRSSGRRQWVPAQVPGAEPRPPRPYPESGLPPAGDDYVNPAARSGAVRPDWPADNPPEKAIDEQTKTQKEQQARRERGG